MAKEADLTRVAVAGFGAIGQAVAKRLVDGLPGLRLSAVASRDLAKVRAALPGSVEVVPVADLVDHADVVVECAPSSAFRAIAEPTLHAGRTLVVLSCGALLQHEDLIELARRSGGRIAVPTGALLGLDAVLAAAEGVIESVRLTTRKPPAGLAGAPHLVEHGIDVSGVTEPTLVFEGSARDAAMAFPANVNVAVALSLAGIGPDRTRVAVWADPTVTRNTHRIEVESDAARLAMTIENIPSENPRTGRITAQSVVAHLRKLHAPLAVGT